MNRFSSPFSFCLLLFVVSTTSACALRTALWGAAPKDALSGGATPATEGSAAEGAPAPSGEGTAAAAAANAAGEDDDAEADGEEEGAPEEGESHEVAEGEGVLRYTTELADQELGERWVNAPDTLGSISLGFVDEGRIVNAMQFPSSEHWLVVSPHLAWGTQETIDFMVTAIQDVKRQHPNAPPLRVNQISAKDGGYLRPHKSHQNGRDVDLGFYYPTAEPVRVRERERHIDVALNWALIKALVTKTDVQMILVDRRVSKVIYDHAVAAGEDKVWLDSIFRAGRDAIVRHARRHRDHFHVRFFNPRAQELGRRVAPLLAQRPEQNLVFHRVRNGDTLGRIAQKYATSVNALRKANRMNNTFLRVAQVLRVPLRGPCSRCPIPPAVVVPPRRLPPTAAEAPVQPLPAEELAPGQIVAGAAR